MPKSESSTGSRLESPGPLPAWVSDRLDSADRLAVSHRFMQVAWINYRATVFSEVAAPSAHSSREARRALFAVLDYRLRDGWSAPPVEEVGKPTSDQPGPADVNSAEAVGLSAWVRDRLGQVAILVKGYRAMRVAWFSYRESLQAEAATPGACSSRPAFFAMSSVMDHILGHGWPATPEEADSSPKPKAVAAAQEIITDEGEMLIVSPAVAQYIDRLVACFEAYGPAGDPTKLRHVAPLIGWLKPDGEFIKGGRAVSVYVADIETQLADKKKSDAK